MACFDCRISQLPKVKDVMDYFRWRNEDASRNALNAHCYWALRKKGHGVSKSTSELEGISVSDKNEILFQHGINFNDLPKWQKRGIGFYWEEIEKIGWNPKENKETTTKRNKIKVDLELPMKEEYSNFVEKLVRKYIIE